MSWPGTENHKPGQLQAERAWFSLNGLYQNWPKGQIKRPGFAWSFLAYRESPEKIN